MASSIDHVKLGNLEDQDDSLKNWPTNSQIDPLAIIHNQQTHATSRMIMAMVRYLKTNQLVGVCSLSVEIGISVDCTNNLNRSGGFLRSIDKLAIRKHHLSTTRLLSGENGTRELLKRAIGLNKVFD